MEKTWYMVSLWYFRDAYDLEKLIHCTCISVCLHKNFNQLHELHFPTSKTINASVNSSPNHTQTWWIFCFIKKCTHYFFQPVIKQNSSDSVFRVEIILFFFKLFFFFFACNSINISFRKCKLAIGNKTWIIRAT